MRRYMGSLSAAALINCDVDKDRTVFHLLKIFLLKELRGRPAGDKDRSDDQVSILNCLLNVGIRRDQSLYA